MPAPYHKKEAVSSFMTKGNKSRSVTGYRYGRSPQSTKNKGVSEVTAMAAPANSYNVVLLPMFSIGWRWFNEQKLHSLYPASCVGLGLRTDNLKDGDACAKFGLGFGRMNRFP